MDGKNLTRLQRLELIERREAEVGIQTKALLDTSGFYPAGGGEFNYLPLIHGPGADEAREGMEAALTGKATSSAFFAVVGGFIRSYLEPQLRLWNGPWMDVPRGTVIDRHPINDLIQTPHPGLTFDDLDAMRLWDMIWDGDATLVKRRSGGGDIATNTTGAVRELWPVPPGRLKPKLFDSKDPRYPLSNGWIDYYRWQVRRNTYVEIPPQNVVHFVRNRRSATPQVGIPTIKQIAAEVALDREVNAFYRAVLSNLGVPGLMVFPDWSGQAQGEGKPIDRTAREDMQARIDRRTVGERRGSTIVFSRPVKVEQFESNVAAMKLEHILRHIETRIAGSIGWPAILAGLAAGLDSATYSNAKQLRAFATEDILIGAWTGDGERWHRELAGDFGLSANAWLCYDWPRVRSLQKDSTDLWKQIGEAWGRNELNLQQHHQLLDLDLPEGVDGTMRLADILAGAQMSSLFGPAMGKQIQAGQPGVLDLVARMVMQSRTANGIEAKALPLPGKVTVDDTDAEEAERSFDKWAKKHAPQLVGIMSAVVEEGEDDDG